MHGQIHWMSRRMEITFMHVFLLFSPILLYALPQSSSVKDSTIANINDHVKATARTQSEVNTGVSISSAQIIHSRVLNENRNVTINATNRSNVNTGVKVNSASIQETVIENRFTGKINAQNSTIDMGIRVSDGQTRQSTLRNDTKANIEASNSKVTTGIKVSRAEFSDIKTTAKVNVDAKSSNVNLGTVSGQVVSRDVITNVVQDVKTRSANVNIGTVKAGDSAMKWEQQKSFGNEKNVQIGNVDIIGGRLREITVSVGTKDLNEKILVKHMSKTYQGETAPDGTAYLYVDKRSKEQVMRKGGSVGNYQEKNASKVHTFVE